MKNLLTNDILVRAAKTCADCLVVKDLSHFHANKNTKDGKVTRCKPCTLARRKTHYYKDVEESRRKSREIVKRRWANNSEHMKAVRRAYLAKNPHKAKEWGRRGHLKFQYGVTPEWVDEQTAAQNSQCLLCNRQTELVVDHDHKTNKVRGLICNPCNMFVGFIERNEVVLDKFKQYLEGDNNA